MSKITGLDRPNDLLIKLLREGSRLRFEIDDNNRIDHFFNFSVTAHSMRDWCLEELHSRSSNTNFKTLKTSLNLVWDEIIALSVAKDISNSVKHFKIRRYKPDVENANNAISKQVVLEFPTNSSVIDVALSNAHTEKIIETPSIEILFNDGSVMGLDEYIINTVFYWATFFDQNKIERDHSYDVSFPFFRLDIWPNLIAARSQLPND